MSDDAQQQNQNDLPSHWQVHTSINSEEHRDDAPLFPVLKEKPLIAKTDAPLIENSEEKLLSEDREELLDSGKVSVLIDNENKADTLIENDNNPIISNDEVSLLEEIKNEKLASNLNQNISSNTVNAEPIPSEEKVEVEVVVKTDDLKDEAVEPSERNNSNKEIAVEFTIPEIEVMSAIDDNLNGEDIKKVDTTNIPEEVEIKSDVEVFEDESADLKLNNDFVKNNNMIKLKKVIPVPHAKIREAVDSEHPLTLAPRVIPFSTPAPSVHTKIAAVYTQPEARASVWLPWMRTSMWTRKMVKRATKHPEVDIVHENLPSVVSTGKPNVVYSPIYVNPDKPPVIVKEVKADTIFEKPAQVSRIDFDSNKKEDVAIPDVQTSAVVENKVTPLDVEPKNDIAKVIENDLVKDKPKPEVVIDDMFDSALFSGSVSEKPVFDINKPNGQNVQPEVKPKIADSWDAEMFS